jgi:hypothetical protein
MKCPNVRIQRGRTIIPGKGREGTEYTPVEKVDTLMQRRLISRGG